MIKYALLVLLFLCVSIWVSDTVPRLFENLKTVDYNYNIIKNQTKLSSPETEKSNYSKTLRVE